MDIETRTSSSAAELAGARRDVRAVPPLAKRWADLDADTGFRIQQQGVAERVAAGDRVVGYKLGNVAKAMQDAFGLDRPDYGHLLADTFLYEELTVDRQNYIEPFVELEPAFVLKEGLRGPNTTAADVLTATAYVLPAIEIIDSRFENWDIALPDTLADNGSTGSVVLGGAPSRLEDVDLRDMHGQISLNGEVLSEGSTREILGNPVSAIAWLADRLAPLGVEFAPGDVILPGSCLRAVPMERPGTVAGRFAGLGSVAFEVL